MITINEIGLEEIREQLINQTLESVWDGWLTDEDLKDSSHTMHMLYEWAETLEDDIDIQGIDGGSVEMSRFITKSGHVETLTVSRLGLEIINELGTI